MKRPGSLAVAPARALPKPLARLATLALDLQWAWNHTGDSVWRRLDEAAWERTQNPWLLLQHVPFERLERLAGDADFLRDLRALEESRARYRAAAPWRPPGAETLPRVAYFSMEFGLHEALPLYAGGLGVLAGDFLKTASDLGTPVVGIGILWQQGYFRQVLDGEGWQTELYPFNEPASLPVEPVLGASGQHLRVSLVIGGRTVLLRAWRVSVGRTQLYLLDSNDPFNAPADRGLTSTLYGGGPDVRLMQDVILGIGGWRLVEALDLGIDVCHLNEGHAAFAVLERARHFMARHETSFGEAVWATRPANVFTTHTAVAAGFDVFPREQLEVHRADFDAYVRSLGLSWPELLALGRANPDDPSEPFNMAWLAVRGCGWVNGVSRLHGAVSRTLFSGLFPRWPEAEVPVTHVTNGVHVPSWDSPWTDEAWTRAAGKERWRGDVSALTERVLRLSDEELWRLRALERADLVRYARERLASRLARFSGLDAAIRTASIVLSPDVLTLGFARRFAGYKRPNLLLSDPERLLRLLTDAQRPVQLIVAGKAHPRDHEGKRLVQQWARFAGRPEARAHVVFLDDYDMTLAKELVQGVDVWINTPRRPWEASGTSGMKVLVNGGLNLSTLDGWWAEAFDAVRGWAVGHRSEGPGDDAREAGQLYSLLEDEVVPAFYERDASGYPRRWMARMRASMASLAPQFSSVRMLQEYVERAYVPGAAACQRRATRASGVARELEAWSTHLKRHWDGIRFGEVTETAENLSLSISARIDLGDIHPASVRVELYADARNEGRPEVHEMTPDEARVDHDIVYSTTIPTGRPPSDYTVRVVPYHPEARIPTELPLIAWRR